MSYPVGILDGMHRRAMLQTLTGELGSPWGDRVHLYRPAAETEQPGRINDGLSCPPIDEPDPPDQGMMHPGRWRVYHGPKKIDYASAEAILADGWLVE